MSGVCRRSSSVARWERGADRRGAQAGGCPQQQWETVPKAAPHTWLRTFSRFGRFPVPSASRSTSRLWLWGRGGGLPCGVRCPGWEWGWTMGPLSLHSPTGASSGLRLGLLPHPLGAAAATSDTCSQLPFVRAPTPDLWGVFLLLARRDTASLTGMHPVRQILPQSSTLGGEWGLVSGQSVVVHLGTTYVR